MSLSHNASLNNFCAALTYSPPLVSSRISSSSVVGYSDRSKTKCLCFSELSYCACCKYSSASSRCSCVALARTSALIKLVLTSSSCVDSISFCSCNMRRRSLNSSAFDDAATRSSSFASAWASRNCWCIRSYIAVTLASLIFALSCASRVL